MIANISPIIIPIEVLQNLGKTEKDLKIELAVMFYRQFNLPSGQAAQFAGISRVGFFYELGKRNIPINYDESDALHDVEAIKKFNQKFPPSSK